LVFSTLSYPLQIVDGIAKYLEEHGIASWDEFGEGEPYTGETEWPIYLGPDMPVSPNRVIVITPGVQSFMRADVMTSVQIRLRGTPSTPQDPHRDEVSSKMQEIHDLFYPNGFPLAHVTMGNIRVGAVFPGDAQPLDPDGSRRHGALQNFRLRTRRPRPV